MIYPTQLRVTGLCQPLGRLQITQRSFAPVFVRGKALSAIHRGIRREIGRADPDAEPTSFREPRSSFRKAPSTRREAPLVRRDAFADKFSARAVDRGAQSGGQGGTRNWRQEQKLRKKLRKKDEEKKAQEEREADGTGRRTRRRRFADPENEFGSRSLVHRMKYGDLKDVADGLQIQEPVKPRSFRETRRERSREFGALGAPPRKERRPERSGEQSDRWSDKSQQRFEGSDRSAPRDEQRPERSGQQFDRSDRQFDRSDRRSDRWSDKSQRFNDSDRSAPRNEQRTERPGQFDRSDRRSDRWSDKPQQRFHDSDRGAPRQDNFRNDRWNGPQEDSSDVYAVERAQRNGMMAMTIKYTTAASQFLYGRSVVKAALEQNRRKLYNLYIYGGENRRDNKDNTIMTRMAEKHGVPITIVPTEEQRIMDKMSMGRPHNGFVLEASPLPQLPIKSLSKLEESPGRLGFHVDLDYQTKEEAAVNGTDSFIRRSNDVTPKPFVLLLNEIIDPGNLGGIIRTASYLGVDAVAITNRGSSTLTPVVLKSAVGAVEEISLFTVDDPVRFIEDSGKAGWKTYAAVAPPDRKLVRRHGDKFVSLDSIEINSPLNEDPCLLVLGNEGHGLSKPVKVAADYELSVPRFVQGSCVDSLNVSVAAGLLCHAFVKEPVVETKYEPVEQKTETVESVEVDSITEVEAETKPIDQAQSESGPESESVSTSEQIENVSEQVEKTTEEIEVTTKEEEKPSEEKEKKVEGTNETMF